MLLCTAAKPLGAQNVVEQQGDTLKTAVVTASAKPSPTLQSAPLQVMSKSDFENDNFVFCETKYYRFSFITTKIGADFFAQSKKTVPDSSVIQSLSETQPFRIS